MEKLSLELKGMGCGGCVANVKRALGEVHGVKVEEVTIGSANLHYDPSLTSPHKIAEALEQAGYPVQASAPPIPAR